MPELHVEGSPSLRHAPQSRGIAKEFRKRNIRLNYPHVIAVFHGAYDAALRIHVARRISQKFRRDDNLHFHNRFKKLKPGALYGLLKPH